ncbi:hypothetical protein ZEAMMB73_Zm00001d041614 [Zea mays]|uniref:Uncharacterized protein n=1 Tax=Zea mays TaxID=4577 RepID=A0A1R3PJX5_MAIZE|nr:hypothetical protein ZEAMMB73_Zm00001d041614 [Zea mays]
MAAVKKFYGEKVLIQVS